jgi:xanthine/uracil permease
MKKIISAMQWTAFIIAANLIAPIAIASSFGLSSQDTMLFLQRTLFILGLAGFLQGVFGHKLPINEGPAGIWWGVFVLYASLSETLFGGSTETLRVLSFSLMLCGIICIVLSLFGLLDKLSKLFTPIVVGTYLILLLIQLASEFLKGMMGIGYIGDKVSLPILLISILLVILSIIISKTKRMKSFTVIIVILVGWIIYKIFGFTKPIPEVQSVLSIPKIFVFGVPKINLSMIPTIILVTLLLLTNMLASIQVIKTVVDKLENKKHEPNIKKAGLVMGINQILSGIFSAVGPVPLSGAAGFITQTNIVEILPFILANVFIMIISLCLPCVAFFSTLPTPVGYASIFTIFANMIGLAMQEFDMVENRNTFYKAVGIPIFIGPGLMFVGATAFNNLPTIVTCLLSNGLVCGTTVALIIEIKAKLKLNKK